MFSYILFTFFHWLYVTEQMMFLILAGFSLNSQVDQPCLLFLPVGSLYFSTGNCTPTSPGAPGPPSLELHGLSQGSGSNHGVQHPEPSTRLRDDSKVQG